MAYHDEYVERISAAIDGALSPAQQAELEAHLATCPDCKALYDDLNRIHQTLQGLPTVAVPEGLTDRIVAAVQADNVTPITVKKPTIQWKRWAATAAVLALILAGAGGLGLLSGREVMSPATSEAPTPEAIAPAITRSLPQVPVATLPTGDTQDDQSTDDRHSVTTQGADPISTPEPTLYVVQTTTEPATVAPTAAPAEAPEGTEENPTNYMGNPFTLAPIMTVPPTPTTPDDQEDETPEIGVMSVGLEPEMTEAELAAMEQLRLYLGLPEGFEWENAVTCLWADGETPLRLTYLGLDSGGLCYMFNLSQDTLLYLVPVDGGEIITAEP